MLYMKAARRLLLVIAIAGAGFIQTQPVFASSGHPQMNCDVDADSFGRGGIGTNISVDINCDFWSFEDHADLEGQKQQMVIFQGGYASEHFRITLGERFSIGNSHPDLDCSGTLSYQPDPSGFSFSDRYFLTLICREGGIRAFNAPPHPEMYCQPTLSGMQRSSFEMECWAISASAASNRRWLWYHPDGTLVASFRGKKSGQVIVRSDDPSLTQVTLRQWKTGGNWTEITIPLADGVGVYVAPTKKRGVGILDVGNYLIEGVGGYYVRSPSIIWGR